LVRGLKGGFRRAIEGLKKVQAENESIKVVVNTLVVKHNFRHLMDVIRMGMEFRIRHFRFLAYNFIPPYDLMGMQSRALMLSTEEIMELREIISEVIAYCRAHHITLNSHDFLRGIPQFYTVGAEAVNCFAGYASVHVHSNGRVSFCSSLEAGIGNVREQRLTEIWGSQRFLTRRKEMMSAPCNKCYVSCYIEQNHWFTPKYVVSRLVGIQ
jgi:MoaA/NifB/PqqE/SkfB family radical SAM enzyme